MIIDGLTFTEIKNTVSNVVSFDRKIFSNIKIIVDTFTIGVTHEISFDGGATITKMYVYPMSLSKSDEGYLISYSLEEASPEKIAYEEYKDIKPLADEYLQIATIETILNNVKYLPLWVANKAYKRGNRFKFNNKPYEVISDTTSNEDKIPDKSPSLYKEVTKENKPTYPEWEKGKEYNKGDKVLYRGELYECTWDKNIRDPTGLGWKKV